MYRNASTATKLAIIIVVVAAVAIVGTGLVPSAEPAAKKKPGDDQFVPTHSEKR